MIKTLVVTSCTGEKKFHPQNQLLQSDFENKSSLQDREKELAEFQCSAGEMYTGMQHLRLMEGIQSLRKELGEDIVDLCIVSAGYGLINESRVIVPYEVTFNTMNASGISEWSQKLGIHEDLSDYVREYDLVFFLLGDKYLRAVALPLENTKPDQKILVFASGTSRKMIPYQEPYYFIEVGQEDAKSFSYGLVGLKGYLFKLLSQDIVTSNGGLLEKIYQDPSIVMATLKKYRKKEESVPMQMSLFGDPEPMGKKMKPVIKKAPAKKKIDIYIPDSELAANYSPHIKYFIPEWDDRVDPDYDFILDKAVEGRDPYSHDVYAHEIYSVPNYDGVLISKCIVEQNKTKKARIEEMGVHKFIRFDESRPIMGDCGAFGYVDQDEPPYETPEILDYYEKLGFQIGVSIDHLIVGKYASDIEERNRRYKLTRENAAKFIEQYKSGKYTFLPSGVAQGWDPKSYRDSVANLIEMGYEHICLGGLVRTNTQGIIEILKEVKPLIPEYLQLHLFGIARLEACETFRRLGVSAMDSASYLRRAWLGSDSNYFSLDGQKYAAIRVPPVNEHGKRTKKMAEEGRGTIEQFKELEKAALDALRKFDAGLLSIDDTLKPVLEYDTLIGDDRGKHPVLYRKLLEDKPWKACGCEICKNAGIEVVIFRGNNRNRRRGFHNTYVFYKKLKELYPDD